MQAVSAGANGPSSHRKQQEKQKLYGSLNQIFMKSKFIPQLLVIFGKCHFVFVVFQYSICTNKAYHALVVFPLPQ
jgi:hypothetical protein